MRRGSSSLRLEHAFAERVADQLVAVAQAKLLHDPLAVSVDRLGADDQLFGDLGAAVALGDQLQHFAFALGQAIVRLLFAGRAIQIAIDQQLGGGGVQEHFTSMDGPNGLDQLGVGARLEHVTAAAGLEQRQQVLRLGVHGQDEHLGPQPTLANGAGGFEAAHTRHLDVHHDHVGLNFAGCFDRRRAISRLADYLDVRLNVQKRLQASAQHSVVIGQDHADLRSVGGHTTRPVLGEAGTWASICVPRPGALSITSWPRTRARRSCMPNNPSPRSRERITSSTSKPWPLSITDAMTSLGVRRSSTCTRCAAECFAALVNASWTTRYSTSSS